MRTLNDIVPPSRRGDITSPNPTTREPLNLSQGRPPRFPYVTLIVVALIIAVSVGALLYFSSAAIQITPTTVSAAVQSTFTANKSSGTLPFEVITAQKIASQSVKGSGSKTVTASASGMITISNKQTKAQTLIANTRFATASGLIFRLHAPVTIPAGGTATAKVFADQAGASFNVEPTTFTVPGFAGTAQATLVTAKSSSAMTGGASGTVLGVDPAIEEQARTSLKVALEPDLMKSLKSQVPEGYTLLSGAVSTSYEALPSDSSATTGQLTLKEQGTMTAVIFPNTALAKAIALSVAGLTYQGEPLTTSSDKLTLSSSGLPDDATTYTFNLSGTAQLTYSVDPSRIAAAVAGKTRSGAEVAVSNFPEVKRAVIILRPFWRQTFPQDPSSTTVTVVGDK